VASRDDERYAPPRDPRDARDGRDTRDAAALAPSANHAAGDYPAEARGLAGSAAHRLAGPDPDEPLPARPTGGGALDHDLDAWAAGAGGSAAGPSRAVPPRRYEPSARHDERSRDRGAAGRDQAGKPAQQDAQELFGPAWERPRRYEAYPSLRTRMGLPAFRGVPKPAVWAGILIFAALFLFLFGPSLLGIGRGDGGGTGATPTPRASAAATATPAPTVPPAPTPQVYTVASGDTMSKIAKRYGVTIDAILHANPKIKDPNKIKVGDRITIPLPAQDGASSNPKGTVKGQGSAAP